MDGSAIPFPAELADDGMDRLDIRERNRAGEAERLAARATNDAAEGMDDFRPADAFVPAIDAVTAIFDTYPTAIAFIGINRRKPGDLLARHGL